MTGKKFILWLMGPTSSGKTTIAENLVPLLRKKEIPVIHYDGDEVRDFLGANHGFTDEHRLRVISILVHLANKAHEAGFNVVVSALTAHNSARVYIQEHIITKLLVAYVKCSINKCIKRDPKGLYQKAINNEIKTLIGYNSEYLPPEHPDIIISTEGIPVEESVRQLLAGLQNCGFLLHDKFPSPKSSPPTSKLHHES